jgi:hypothetical protein
VRELGPIEVVSAARDSWLLGCIELARGALRLGGEEGVFNRIRHDQIYLESDDAFSFRM